MFKCGPVLVNGDNVQRGRAVVAARRVARPLADPAFLQIVERLQPAADREDGIGGIELEEGCAADLAAADLPTARLTPCNRTRSDFGHRVDCQTA